MDYLVTVNCAKCGKEFVPAPYNVFKKNGLHYCSYNCYTHRAIGVNTSKNKFKVFISIEKYKDSKEVICTYLELLKKENVEVVKTSYRAMTFETKNVAVKLIPEAMNIKGLECDECFGLFGKNDKLYLRRIADTEPYSGTALEYILEKESVMNVRA